MPGSWTWSCPIAGLRVEPYAVGLISDINGGNLGQAILSIYWLRPVIAAVIVAIIAQVSRDEATVLERTRAAGEAV